MIVKENIKINGNSNNKKRIVIISDTHITPTGGSFNEKAFHKGMHNMFIGEKVLLDIESWLFEAITCAILNL